MSAVKKIAMFVFNDNPIRFAHVLLNALDMFESDYETKVIIEGAATKLISELSGDRHPINGLYEQAKHMQLIEGVCRTCSYKHGTSDEAVKQGLALLDDISGHPAISRYLDMEFKIITF